MSYRLVKPGSYTYRRDGKKGVTYRVLFRQEGVHLDEPVKATSDREAMKLARKRIDQAMRREQKPAPMVTIEEIGAEVIASKVGVSTQKDAKFWIERRLLPWFAVHSPFITNFNEAVWEDYLAFEGRNRPGAKLFNCRKYMSQIVRRALKKGILTREMTLRNPDPKRAAGKVFTDEEIKKLLGKARPDLRLQILMAYSMGMRRSEVLRLRWDRVDLQAGVIHLRAEDTKIRQGRSFRMNRTVHWQLMARRKANAKEWVFPSKRSPGKPVLDNKTAWQALKIECGIRGRFHDLRHTFITRQIMQDKNRALDVCIYAGLSLEEMKRTYLHPTVEDTAYIAEGQDEKLGALCRNFVEQEKEALK